MILFCFCQDKRALLIWRKTFSFGFLDFLVDVTKCYIIQIPGPHERTATDANYREDDIIFPTKVQQAVSFIWCGQHANVSTFNQDSVVLDDCVNAEVCQVWLPGLSGLHPLPQGADLQPS